MGLEEFFKRVRREMEELVREIEEEFFGPKPMWSTDGSIEPLITMQEHPDRYEIIIDLPLADLKSLSIEVKGRRLRIQCTLRKTITFPTWSAYGTTKFHKYKTEILLPENTDPQKINIEKIEDKNMVKITVPKKQ